MQGSGGVGTRDKVIKNAVKEYLAELKSDPFYRLTVNVQDASDKEAAEILAEIEGLTDDDLSIASTRRFTVYAEADDGQKSKFQL